MSLSPQNRALAAAIVERVRAGNVDPGKAAEALGEWFDQDFIMAVFEHAARADPSQVTTVPSVEEIDLDALEKVALFATEGPWTGDRVDGTVKYDVRAPGVVEPIVIIHGDNGGACNDEHGCYGILAAYDERFILTFDPPTVLKLIALAKLSQPQVMGEPVLVPRASGSGGVGGDD